MTDTIDMPSRKPAVGYVTGPQVWWLSFMDDDVFRGVVIVEAGNVGQAERHVERLGIRPDGECHGMNVGHIKVDARFLNRVLTKEECAEVTPVTGVGVSDGDVVSGFEAEPVLEGGAQRGGLLTAGRGSMVSRSPFDD